MICISVTPESRQLAKVDLFNAAGQCDLIELCLDRLLKEPDVKDLIEGAKKPILVSCRRHADGGAFKGTEDERLMLLRQAILANPAYVELDLETAHKIPRFGKVQRVISHTSLDRPLGSNIEAIFDEAVAAKADIIKFTWPTQTLEAAWPLLAAVSQKRALPVVGLGLGRCGLTFSLLGRKYGSPWIYAALEKGMEAFPGQPSVGDLDNLYRWRQVGPKTRFIGVVGFNETELATVKVLNAAFDHLDMNTRCLPFDVKSTDQLGKMLDILKVPAVIATPAYGRKLLSLVQTMDDVTKQAQYADLLLKQPDGWQGYNLIGRVALKVLEAKLAKDSTDSHPLDRRNAMILGSGGLAQALAVGIHKRKGLVSVCAGDDAEAQQLAAATQSRYVPIGKLYDTLVDLVIVTVTNLDHGTKKTPINPSLLKPGQAFVDLTDPPGESKLCQEARERSCKVVEPADVFTEYVSQIFKSLTGQNLPAEAFATGLEG
ncbi:MAG: type I 3-dehydroquinate dehydratase [Planctomycetaceae bacterium]|nr:type I 3-dehydroquinate dehydratase [Planctomycetaceae bacterium]